MGSQPQRHLGPGARARRIEHVNFKAPDVLAVRDVFTKLPGMELSDRTAGDEFNWFRCHDGYHHTLAVFRSDTPSVHHYAFDFHALEDLAGIADGLVIKDRALLWGPGRQRLPNYVDPNIGRVFAIVILGGVVRLMLLLVLAVRPQGLLRKAAMKGRSETSAMVAPGLPTPTSRPWLRPLLAGAQVIAAGVAALRLLGNEYGYYAGYVVL